MGQPVERGALTLFGEDNANLLMMTETAGEAGEGWLHFPVVDIIREGGNLLEK